MELIIITILILGALGYLGWHTWRKVRAKSCGCGCGATKPRETSTKLTVGGRSV